MHTEELRTKLVWDTADVDKGEQRVLRALDRVTKAQEEADAKRKKGGKHGGGHAGMGNFGWGIHDLAEGRITQGIFRLTSAFKLSGAAAIGAFTAFKFVSNVLGTVREQIDATDKASTRLNDSWAQLNKSSTFSSAGEGESSLSSKITQNRAAFNDERDLQHGLERNQANPYANVFGKVRDFVFNGMGSYSAGMTGAYGEVKSPEQQENESKLRQALVAKNAVKLSGLRSKSITDELGIARAKGPGGDSFDARRMELSLQEKQADTVGKMEGYSKQDLQNVKDRFAVMTAAVDVEEEIARFRFLQASASLGIDASNRGDFAKRVGQSRLSLSTSNDLINSGSLNAEQLRAETLNVYRQEGEQKKMLRDKYLNSDGRRRSRSEVDAEFRNDRQAKRRKDLFDDQMKKNGGLVNVHRDASGNIISGQDALTREKISDPKEIWRRQHGDAEKPPKKMEQEDSKETATLKEILSALKAGLPKETK